MPRTRWVIRKTRATTAVEMSSSSISSALRRAASTSGLVGAGSGTTSGSGAGFGFNQSKRPIALPSHYLSICGISSGLVAMTAVFSDFLARSRYSFDLATSFSRVPMVSFIVSSASTLKESMESMVW